VVTKIRKLAKNGTFRAFAVPLAAFAFVFFVVWFAFWPLYAFQAGARWVGEVFWVGILLLAVVVAVMAQHSVRDEREGRTQSKGTVREISPAESKADQSAFARKVRVSLKDGSIVGYLKRNLVTEDYVTEALVDGDAFRQAVELDSYKSFTEIRSKVRDTEEEGAMILDEDANFIAIAVFVDAFILTALLFTEISLSNVETSGIAFASMIFAGCSAWLLARARIGPGDPNGKLALPLLAMCISLCIIIFPPFLINIGWLSIILILLIWCAVWVLCYILPTEGTLQQCLSLLVLGWRIFNIPFLKDDKIQYEKKWLDDCESIVKEQVNLTINTVLGKDKDRFLVEQDSEGLRRLQDPSYTVSTRSEHRIASVLSQMDGASIALAGPRGAGKSTLLRKFSGPLRSNIDNEPCISLYLTAPAEYVPRDFIASLFQQLCEAYLLHEQCPLPEPIYKERSKSSFRHTFGRFFYFLWLCICAAILIAIIVLIIRSFISTHYHRMYETVLNSFRSWYNQTYHYINRSLYKKLRPYWTWIRIFILIIALLALLALRRSKGRIKPGKEPALAKKAREYLHRLQVDKTITWGTSIGSPAVRGASFSLNRGGTASYVPWTLPELVAHTRRFMQCISEQFPYSSNAVVVGIDEIDRIGSVDHAERFIGEIKAIFGVEKCFFLVAVAEDVGSIFAQRATAGRSILENAFDDIVMVEPLNFQETRYLLLKRVPGFTDSFVYLVHALSGGLPRELIRITRRLVDVNQEATAGNVDSRLQDLAFCLVKEELIEAMRATRKQMARLTLNANWTLFFERLQSANSKLGYASPLSVNESYVLIKELSELTVPDAPEGALARRALVMTDEEGAKRIVRDFAAFSYFGMTVIEAFSDRFFDLQVIQQAAASGSEGSYEELALARAELTVSPENTRVMLRRFRDSLSTH
jgi:Cdc6-like AAA superfamily ATPase